MERKPGGYRKPTPEQRKNSMIDKEDFHNWFSQIWEMPGASTKNGHPAPFPLELATRLIRMFSFTGDTVLDPFCGSGTTMLAAAKYGRNSIGIETEAYYCNYAVQRLESKMNLLNDYRFKYTDLSHEADCYKDNNQTA